MATILPMLGTVRGKLGALQFGPGTRVATAGPGGHLPASSRQGYQAVLAEQYASCPLDRRQEMESWRGRRLNALAYTRCWSVLSLANAATENECIGARTGILPYRCQPPDDPPFEPARITPTTLDIILTQGGITLELTWAGIDMELMTSCQLWYCLFAGNLIKFKSNLPTLYGTHVVDGACDDETVSFTLPEITTASPSYRYLVLGSVRVLYPAVGRGQIPEEGGRPAYYAHGGDITGTYNHVLAP